MAATIALPAGKLGTALVSLGQQAGISVGISDPSLGSVRVKAVRGEMSAGEALRRLLAGTGLEARGIDAQSYRIIRVARASSQTQAPAKPKPARMPPPPAALGEIIVTASKQHISLARFAGSATILELDGTDGTALAPRGSEAIVARLPVIATTNLGAGRNKLFIRGVADSSFTGATQATVGQYLDEVRLTYNAPDPNLSLYDIASVEVLEGPQATLYGAGSLGGLIRLVPQRPQLDKAAASFAAGLSDAHYGQGGWDAAAMINLPLTADTLGARLVAYRTVDGGYIDDDRRNLRDINRTTTTGGRASLRYLPADGWTVDLGAVYQRISTPDSQYSLRGLPSLTRSSTLAQPFVNNYKLLHVTVHRQWDGLELVSATGYVNHRVNARYDASGFRGTTYPLAYDDNGYINFISHETRLSRAFGNRFGWVAGVSMIYDRDRMKRQVSVANQSLDLTGVRNTTFEAALFGEATAGLTSKLRVTLGGRANYARLSGRPIDTSRTLIFVRSRIESRFQPTAAISWQVTPALSWFARYQRGFRAGGLAVARGISNVSQFQSDTIAMLESGIRYSQPGDHRFTATASLSRSSWSNIQADLIDRDGLPVTANIGDGRVYGLELAADWAPLTGVSASMAMFINDSALTRPAAMLRTPSGTSFPDTPKVGMRGTLGWRRPLPNGMTLIANANTRYVGRSYLGVGPLLRVEQGDYVEVGAGVGLDFSRFGVSIDVANLTDTRANRFSIGNPFQYARNIGQQITPLRPRTIRFGVHGAF